MADQTIRKTCREGIGSAAVDLSDVRHVMAAATPRRGESLDEQADDALRAIRTAVEEEGARGSIVQQTVFLADAALVRTVPADRAGVLRRPAPRHHLRRSALVRRKARGHRGDGRRASDRTTSRSSGSARRSSSRGITASPGSTWRTRSRPRAPSAFTGRRRAASWSGCDNCSPASAFASTRWCGRGSTWAEILELKAAGAIQGSQPPKRLLPRHQFSRRLRPRVGQRRSGARPTRRARASGRRIAGWWAARSLDSGRREIRAAALENPRQTAAYDYAAAYDPQAPSSPRWPFLPRSTRRSSSPGRRASRASETRHAGDPVAQTHQTLDNIADLICEENLARHEMAGLGASLASLAPVPAST